MDFFSIVLIVFFRGSLYFEEIKYELRVKKNETTDKQR